MYNIPPGFELTARLTTNYRCLKNIWRQRRSHKLPEWREFCKWIETLPYAKDLICYEKEEKKTSSAITLDQVMERLTKIEDKITNSPLIVTSPATVPYTPKPYEIGTPSNPWYTTCNCNENTSYQVEAKNNDTL